jgi:hypothetical protein
MTSVEQLQIDLDAITAIANKVKDGECILQALRVE